MVGRSKYGNIKTSYNGRTFDSKLEATWAGHLDMMKLSVNPKQRVTEVEYQYKMPIVVNGFKICTYIADFRVTFADRHVEIWDAKGVRTYVYKLKAKLVEAVYGVKIVEV
jgi:hypothetical protein